MKLLNCMLFFYLKVHGGTRSSDIIRKVKKAEEIANENDGIISANPKLRSFKIMDTVLFFDEANTTEAVGIIKEIMCDRSLLGRPIEINKRLKIVAACNPYRKYVIFYNSISIIAMYSSSWSSYNKCFIDIE